MGFGGRLIIYGGNLVTFQGSIPCSPILKAHTAKLKAAERYLYIKNECLDNFS